MHKNETYTQQQNSIKTGNSVTFEIKDMIPGACQVCGKELDYSEKNLIRPKDQLFVCRNHRKYAMLNLVKYCFGATGQVIAVLKLKSIKVPA